VFDYTRSPPSYAAGEAETLDLYIGRALHLDQQSGAIRYRTGEERSGQSSGAIATPEFTGGGLLIKWDEVEYFEFISFDATSSSEAPEEADGPKDV